LKGTEGIKIWTKFKEIGRTLSQMEEEIILFVASTMMYRNCFSLKLE